MSRQNDTLKVTLTLLRHSYEGTFGQRNTNRLAIGPLSCYGVFHVHDNYKLSVSFWMVGVGVP